MNPQVVPDSVRNHLGAEATEGLLQLLTRVESDWSDQVLNLAEGRFERRLVEETSRIRIDVAELKSDLLKWSFVFWVGQVGAVAALLALMLRGITR